MAKKLALYVLIVLLVLVTFVAIPDRAFVGNHESAPPGRGITALEQRIGELENEVHTLDGQVVDLQIQIDDILARLPHASGITINASASRVGPGHTVQISGTVFDQFGSPLPGAQVEFEATDGSITESATTNVNGHYVAAFTAPGSFDASETITARSSGVANEVTVETSDAPAGIGLSPQNCPTAFECFFITVNVVDDEGAPAVGAAVQWHESAGDRTFSGTTSVNGTTFHNLLDQDGLQMFDNVITVSVSQLDVEFQRTINIQ